MIKRFREDYADSMKVCTDSKEVIFWENERWNISKDNLIIQETAMEFLEQLFIKLEKYSSFLKEQDEINKYKKINKFIKSDKMLNLLMKRYSGSKEIDVLRSQYDRDMRYINCKNGIVDTKTGELLKKKKDIKITKYIDINYVKGKENELFKKSIGRLMNYDEEEILAFKNLLGYLLCGDANQKIIPIITGEKDTGKSQLFELINEVFTRKYVKAVNKSLLVSDWNKAAAPNPELVSLLGTRLALCTETGKLDYLNGDLIKKLVGKDTIVARDLYKSTVSFIPTFVPVIFTNYKPHFDGIDEALVRRILPIDVVNPLRKEEIDIFYKENVLKDKEGLFSFLIDCIIKYNKKCEIIVPKRWEKTKEIYVNKNNPYRGFCNKYLVRVIDGIIDANEMYERFTKWINVNGIKEFPTKTKLTRELKKLKILSYESDGKTKYKGITFK